MLRMPKPENLDFGRRVREAAAELTPPPRLVDIGRALGVERATVSHWFKGRSAASGRNLIALAEFLGVRWQWLSEGKQPRRPDGQKASEFLSTTGNNLAANLLQETGARPEQLAGATPEEEVIKPTPYAETIAAQAGGRIGAVSMTEIILEAQELLRAWLDLPRTQRDKFRREIMIAAFDQSKPEPPERPRAKRRPAVKAAKRTRRS